MSEDRIPERPEDDDYDLLTYGEAGTRLALEIRKYERLAHELDAAGAPEKEMVAARDRLAALRATAERHSRSRLTGEDFLRFFGGDPRARA